MDADSIVSPDLRFFSQFDKALTLNLSQTRYDLDISSYFTVKYFDFLRNKIELYSYLKELEKRWDQSDHVKAISLKESIVFEHIQTISRESILLRWNILKWNLIFISQHGLQNFNKIM